MKNKPMQPAERPKDFEQRMKDERKNYVDSMMGLPPESRRLSVGQEVEIGNLTNARIEAVDGEGLCAVVSYDVRGMREGDLPTGERTTSVWPWTAIIPKRTAEETDFAEDEYMGHAISTTLSEVIHRAFNRSISAESDYQRDYVWTLKNKQDLIESIFEQRDIGKIIFIQNPYPENAEVLDGKQRLSALVDFVSSRFSVRGKYWHELSKSDRYTMMNRTVQIMELNSKTFDKEKQLRLFLSVNSAGVPQTDEHLKKVASLLEQVVEAKALLGGSMRSKPAMR
jgi:Protein of unknown function DUF262